jgi:hypothetical protein
MSATSSKKHNSVFVNILWIGLLTGTLDMIGAMIWSGTTNAAPIFKYIASGEFGKAAFTGGTPMVLWGVFFHYLIAYTFTAIFYLMYPAFISTLRNKYVTALVFAAITWIITNLVIVPVSSIGWHDMHLKGIVIGYVVLIFSIGLPIVLIADKTRQI